MSAPRTGFCFKNCFRNRVLETFNVTAPQPYKTGTTIAGVVFKDGVVLGADTRATEDPIIVDGHCKKIHYLAENIYCCGAGISADVEGLAQLMSSNLELMRLSTQRPPRVRCATRLLKQMLFRYHGHLYAALIIGGVDATGPRIATVYPHGSTDVLPFATMGSGALAAMAVLETGYKANMELGAAKSLVKKSILAGINNDLASGSRIDICVIQKDQDIKQSHQTVYVKGKRHEVYAYEPRTTSIINETVEKLECEITDFKSFPIDGSEDEDL